MYSTYNTDRVFILIQKNQYIIIMHVVLFTTISLSLLTHVQIQSDLMRTHIIPYLQSKKRIVRCQ